MRIAKLLAAIALVSCAGASGPPLDASPQGAVTECRLSASGVVPPLDIAIAIDVSRSTGLPSGLDLDGDGHVGELRNGASSDPGDSLLAAEVAAVKALLRSTEGLEAWFSVISYSGGQRVEWEPPIRLVDSKHAMLDSVLSNDLDALESVLDRVLERGSRGRTDFAAGMGTALRTLVEAPKVSSSGRRIVFFLSDSPTPVSIGPINFLHSDPRMARLARRANEAGVVFYTFGLGPAARTAPPHALSLIAGATGGSYHIVENPTALHCDLLRALADAGSTY